MQLTFSEADVRYEAFAGSGPGGQYRNKHQNCIRAIHEPTGIVAVATSERSQTQNKAAALALLKARLRAVVAAREAREKKARRDAKPAAGFGGAAIRTYRLCGKDVGVVDHRSGIRTGVDALLAGKIDPLLRGKPTRGDARVE